MYTAPHEVDHSGIWHTAQMWLGPTSLTKAEATAMLSGPSCTAGSFLLRSQSGGGGLVLCVQLPSGQVAHYRIKEDRGMFTLFDTRREEPQFISLQNLITSYVHIGDAVPSNAVVLTSCVPPPGPSGCHGVFASRSIVSNGLGGNTEA